MIFTLIAKTVLRKWFTTMSHRGFSTQLVCHETQMPLPEHAKKMPVDNSHDGNK